MRSAETVPGGQGFVSLAKLQVSGSVPQYVEDMAPEDGKFSVAVFHQMQCLVSAISPENEQSIAAHNEYSI